MPYSLEKKGFGFTLIELMITVAIVGILSAIAYPSYTSHLKKSNRAAAEAHLMDIAQRQQQYFMDNRAYASGVSALGITTPSDVASKYTIDTQPGTSTVPTFTATATPILGTSQYGDAVLTIDNAGTKTPSDKW